MTNNKLYDIAIIGGGLAGLSLSIQMANAGYAVVVFEKNNYPAHKVCGEYISMESWNHLLHLGLPLNQLNLPIINTVALSDVKGNLYQFNLPLGGFGISRFLLDDELYKIALQKGVHFLIETKVDSVTFLNNSFSIATAKGQYKATIVVGSFGKRSNLDIKLNRNFIQQKPNNSNNHIGVKYHIQFPHKQNQIILHNFKNGYCGMSMVENNIACLCYLTTAKNLQNASNNLKKLEEEILFKNPFLKKIFTGAKFLYQQPLTISQISFSTKSKIENHMLLIGDAAGMITPLCGNGMSMALHGSKLAFEQITMFLQHKLSRTEMEVAYTRAWNKNFKIRLFIGRQIQKLLGNNFITTLFLKLMNALPFLAKGVIKATHGKPF
jgi:menaquinone-9 beta-reductase